MQLIVLGMHRSGTSAITRIINMMGAYFGPEGISLGFDDANKKGFWERKDILHLNRQLLKNQQCNWYKVDGWDSRAAAPEPLQIAIKSLLLELDAHRPWVIKDPRLCLTLPYWIKYLEVPVAIIVSRNPLEVARSLQLRNDMPIEYALSLWEHYAVNLIRHADGCPKIFVQYDALLSAPLPTVAQLFESLQAKEIRHISLPSPREILSFVDPTLYRARKAQVLQELNPQQQRIAAMLQGVAPFDPRISISPQSQSIMQLMGNSITGAPATTH